MCLAQLLTKTRKPGLALLPDEEEEEKQISWTSPRPSTNMSEQGSGVSTHHKSAARRHRLQQDVALAEHGRSQKTCSESQFAFWLQLLASLVGWDWKWRIDFLRPVESAELTFLTDHTSLHFGSSDRSRSSPLAIAQAQSENETCHSLTLLAEYLWLNSGCISLRGYKEAVEEHLEHTCFLTFCTRGILQLIAAISFIVRLYYISFSKIA